MEKVSIAMVGESESGQSRLSLCFHSFIGSCPPRRTDTRKHEHHKHPE
jgi:hypothetical protein